MATGKIVFLIINMLGGAAVLLSYYFGLKAQPSGAGALWGNVPANIRPAYTVSMLLSALGYFLFLYYILFRAEPGDILIAGRYGFGLLNVIFAVILIPSALWMPLTNVYIAHPGPGLWLSIRLVLALVAIGAVALVWAIYATRGPSPGLALWLAVVGSAYFAFHVTVLDAVLWPALYR
jgi:hypothetical protein